MSMYSWLRDFSHSSKAIQAVLGKARSEAERRRLKQFQKVGYTVNSKVYEALSGTRYKYFALAGTLLGIIRENGFIAYDNDLDYGIMIEDNATWNAFYFHMKNKGFRLMHFFVEDDTITEITFLYRGVTIDFYGMQNKGDCLLSCAYYRKKDRPYEKSETSTKHVTYPILGGITERLCHGSVFPVPTNSEAFLESNYGSQWKTPVKNVNVESRTGTRQFLDEKKSFYYSSPQNGKYLL